MRSFPMSWLKIKPQYYEYKNVKPCQPRPCARVKIANQLLRNYYSRDVLVNNYSFHYTFSLTATENLLLHIQS